VAPTLKGPVGPSLAFATRVDSPQITQINTMHFTVAPLVVSSTECFKIFNQHQKKINQFYIFVFRKSFAKMSPRNVLDSTEHVNDYYYNYYFNESKCLQVHRLKMITENIVKIQNFDNTKLDKNYKNYYYLLKLSA
jgi:hypothetical protein